MAAGIQPVLVCERGRKVKRKYALSVDTAGADVLNEYLGGCTSVEMLVPYCAPLHRERAQDR